MQKLKIKTKAQMELEKALERLKGKGKPVKKKGKK